MKILIVVLALNLISSFAFAQGKPTGGGNALDERTNEVIKRIGQIDPTRATAIVAILEWIEHGNTGEKKLDFEESRPIEGKELKADLTPEQKTLAIQLMRERLNGIAGMEPSGSDTSEYSISKNIPLSFPSMSAGGNKLEIEVRSIAAEIYKNDIDQVMTSTHFFRAERALREIADQQVKKLKIISSNETGALRNNVETLWIKNPDSSFTINEKSWNKLTVDQKKSVVDDLYQNL